MADTNNIIALVNDYLASMMNEVKLPKLTSNADRVAMEALIWDTVETYAKSKSKASWEELVQLAGIEPAQLKEGDSVPYDGAAFAVMATKTRPVLKFDDDYFAQLMLKSKHKVPVMTSKSFLQEAKKPGKGRVTLKVVQK